jgi:hypothetical protein
MTSSSKAYSSADSDFVCDCYAFALSACEGEPFYKEHQRKRYCVLHYPSDDKVEAFEKAFKRKIAADDFDFHEVYFPSVANFTNVRTNNRANFSRAVFNDTAYFLETFFDGGASFDKAVFRAEAHFNAARFGKWANFSEATFDTEVMFRHTSFEDARFYGVVFNSEVDFTDVVFNNEADFDHAVFRDYVRFARDFRDDTSLGAKPSLSFGYARIDKQERCSFHTLALRPHWFINVDARKFEFINVNWNWRNTNTKLEIKSLEEKKVSAPHSLLTIACRNLAVNAEENHRYEEASRFRYMAMDARRLERWRGFAFWTLGWWYWLASGYGERVWRAFVVLIGVWLVAAALYTRVGFARWEPRVATEKEAAEARRDEVGEPLRWPRALTYSLGVMTLQKPEPRPATNAAQSLVMLETILGPVQAALLALAIRRKFMR